MEPKNPFIITSSPGLHYNHPKDRILFFNTNYNGAGEHIKTQPELLFTFNSQLSSWIIFCTPFLAHPRHDPRHDCTSIFLLKPPSRHGSLDGWGLEPFFVLFVCNHWLCCLLGRGVGRLHMETKLMTGLAPAGWMATIERIPKKDRNAVVSSWKSTMGLGAVCLCLRLRRNTI